MATLDDAVDGAVVEMVGVVTNSAVVAAGGLSAITGGDKCAFAALVYDFLMRVKTSEGCPWYVVIAIRQLHGAISRLRRKWGCA